MRSYSEHSSERNLDEYSQWNSSVDLVIAFVIITKPAKATIIEPAGRQPADLATILFCHTVAFITFGEMILRQMPKTTRQILACVLLLVFTQKAGLELWLHDWLHAKTSLLFKTHKEAAFHAANCHCVDDFTLPFTETPVLAFLPPIAPVTPVKFILYFQEPLILFYNTGQFRAPPFKLT